MDPSSAAATGRSCFVDLLKRLRQKHPTLSLLGVEMLLLIAQGVDTRNQLEAATGATGGSIRKAVRVLSGQGYKDQGHIVLSRLRVIRSMQNPHERGERLSLTEEGVDLLKGAGIYSPVASSARH